MVDHAAEVHSAVYHGAADHTAADHTAAVLAEDSPAVLTVAVLAEDSLVVLMEVAHIAADLTEAAHTVEVHMATEVIANSEL